MNKPLSILLALIAVCPATWAGNPGVTFLLRSGQNVSFTFAQKPVVTVANEALSVSLGGVQQVSYAYADVQRVVFNDDIVAGIAPVAADDAKPHVVFAWHDGTLSAEGMAADGQLRVYGTDGRLVLTARAQADGTLQLSLDGLQRGVYVVRTQSGISYKLFNK